MNKEAAALLLGYIHSQSEDLEVLISAWWMRYAYPPYINLRGGAPCVVIAADGLAPGP
jgi:hypothetical protein